MAPETMATTGIHTLYGADGHGDPSLQLELTLKLRLKPFITHTLTQTYT